MINIYQPTAAELKEYNKLVRNMQHLVFFENMSFEDAWQTECWDVSGYYSQHPRHIVDAAGKEPDEFWSEVMEDHAA